MLWLSDPYHSEMAMTPQQRQSNKDSWNPLDTRLKTDRASGTTHPHTRGASLPISEAPTRRLQT